MYYGYAYDVNMSRHANHWRDNAYLYTRAVPRLADWPTSRLQKDRLVGQAELVGGGRESVQTSDRRAYLAPRRTEGAGRVFSQ